MAKAKKKHKPLWRRMIRFMVWMLLLGIVISIAEVVAVRFWNPPGTPLMCLRWMEYRRQAGGAQPIRYRWRHLDEVPEDFLRMAVVSEDARFFRHYGFDLIELKHAFSEAFRDRRAPRGASTITMQCARSLFLWQGRSWPRKVLEAYYTVLMEIFLSKERILELYVNVIEMGTGVYGIEAASEFHFDCAPEQLTKQQMALLVAIFPSPRNWDPRHPNDRVQLRKKMILERSAQAGASVLPLERKGRGVNLNSSELL